MLVLVKKLVADVPLPSFAHPGDAGADLVATEDVVLAPGERALVATGISIALPAGTVAYVMPRSGLAIKHGITVLNAPGTIDAGYRGEIIAAFRHFDFYEYTKGQRLVQICAPNLGPIKIVVLDCEKVLDETERGSGGFGSTGL